MSAKLEVNDRQGQLMRATESTFVGLEKIARKRDAKGCYFDRGAHCKAKEMERWLQSYNEEDYTFGMLASSQVCMDLPNKRKLQKQILVAIDQLVQDLPSSFCNEVRKDCISTASMLTNLNTDASWLTFRLELIQHNACFKWHQDNCISRVIIPLVGVGSCVADDKAVDWEEFYGKIDEKTNEKCVPQGNMRLMGANSVILMKGGLWPGIRGRGLTHKAPFVSGKKRLLLKIDLDYSQPPINFDDSSIEGEGEKRGKVGNCGELKRLFTSEEFQQSKAWKCT